MRKVVAYFVKYPIIANIVIAVTLIAGVASFLNTKKAFFPEFDETRIAIRVSYPGASPEEMEEGVTLKIEQAIKNIAGIDEITSTSSENSANINILTLSNYDIDEIFTEVKNAVDGISGFPVSAERPIMFKIKPSIPAAWLSVTGDVNLYTLKEKAELIEIDLLASGVISSVTIMGFPPREISIEVPEETLLRYNLTFDEVAAAVRQNNSDISAGAIKSTSEEILIRSKGKRSEADKIGQIVLRSNDNAQGLLLKDVATITEQFADAPGRFTMNGESAVVLRVDKLPEEDLEEISGFVKSYSAEYNQKGEPVELDVAYDFMDILVQRLNMLQGNGLMGIILVVISLGIFLSLRLSFWVAWGIPSSFLGMFILGSFFGLTVNMISLFGMIIVIGILVDDGIVIAENIYTHFQKTKNPYKAAVDGTMEVLPAVTTSVITTMIAFSPLLLIQGNLNFLSDMAFVVVASLGFSLIEAFFVLPAHLGSKKVLRTKREDTRSFKIRNKINSGLDYVKNNVYGAGLRWTLQNRGISMAILFAFFPLTIGLFQGGFIKATFFPNVPNPNFEINLDLKPGERESEVNAHLVEFEKAVWEINDELKEKFNDPEDFIDFTLNVTGGSRWSNGEHAGQIYVFHRELDGSTVSDTELVDMIRERIGPVNEAERFQVGGAGQFGKPVAVRLLGQDIEELNQAKEALKAELAKIKDLKEVQDDEEIGRRELLLDLTPKAYFLGLTHGELTKQIRQGFFGEEVQRLQKGNDEVRVWVRYPSSDRLSLGQVENMKVKSPTGTEYPLHELASFNIDRGISGIRHYDTNRSVTVDAELSDPEADLPAIMKDVQENIVPSVLASYPGVKVDYGGQSRATQQAQQQMLTYFGIAVVFIFFIIMINFRSFYQAVLIMMMIPLGWLAAMWGHGLQGIPVSLLSAWGMIALSGVIINDAVVFLAKFNSLVKDDRMTIYQAAYHAGLARFRAIMLTSITTCAGLFPLLLETSIQAQIVIPMAVSMAYGVLFGTIIILMFFPVLIMVFNDIRRWTKWLWVGEKPTAEDVERVLIDEKRMDEIKKIA